WHIFATDPEVQRLRQELKSLDLRKGLMQEQLQLQRGLNRLGKHLSELTGENPVPEEQISDLQERLHEIAEERKAILRELCSRCPECEQCTVSYTRRGESWHVCGVEVDRP